MVEKFKEEIERVKQKGKVSVVPVLSFSFNDHPFRRPSFVVYFCGCVHGCRGCHSKVLWNPESEFCVKLSVEVLIEKVLDQYRKADGMVKSLVLLGGDPVEYYPLLVYFLEGLKKKVDLEVVLYTGYLFEELPSDLLEVVDVVVDGKFVEELKTGGFPASFNQRVWVKEKGIWREANYL